MNLSLHFQAIFCHYRFSSSKMSCLLNFTICSFGKKKVTDLKGRASERRGGEIERASISWVPPQETATGKAGPGRSLDVSDCVLVSHVDSSLAVCLPSQVH